MDRTWSTIALQLKAASLISYLATGISAIVSTTLRNEFIFWRLAVIPGPIVPSDVSPIRMA